MASAAQPISPARRHVLIVDDDAATRETLAACLRQAGCDVQIARDGVEAFARLTTFPADVVLTGLELPRMSGTALRDAVRELPITMPHFIFMSAERDPDVAVPFMLLPKPIDLDALSALVFGLG